MRTVPEEPQTARAVNPDAMIVDKAQLTGPMGEDEYGDQLDYGGESEDESGDEDNLKVPAIYNSLD